VFSLSKGNSSTPQSRRWEDEAIHHKPADMVHPFPDREIVSGVGWKDKEAMNLPTPLSHHRANLRIDEIL